MYGARAKSEVVENYFVALRADKLDGVACLDIYYLDITADKGLLGQSAAVAGDVEVRHIEGITLGLENTS